MDSSSFKRFVRLGAGLVIIIGPLFLYLANKTPIQTAVAAQPAELPPLRQATETPTNTPTHTPTPTNTPTASNTPTPSRTPTPTIPPTALYADAYEPNNNINEAYTILANASAACNITLWPVGDEDYFKFAGKAGLAYEVVTNNLDPGLDTVLFVYDTQGNLIASNDDYQFGNRGSQVRFSAFSEGFYYARVINQEPSDPTNKKYCFDVAEIQGTATATPFPTGTRVPGADVAEWNGSIDTAYLIGPGTTYQMNFVPLIGTGPDNDFFRMWIKAGLFYTCETLNLSSVNDTNIILYDSNGNAFNPPIGNDDKLPGNFGSKVSYFATYTGWLHILVGPHAVPEYGLSNLYTYDLRCEQLAVTPTPVATATRTPAPGGGGGPGPIIPTATRTPTVNPLTPSPTFPAIGPTPTAFQSPTATATPAVIILPLPTVTPSGGGQQTVSLDVTLYYDVNGNFTAELTEGVMDVAIALYDNATNQLLAFGYTNEAGQIHFDPIVSAGPIRISVPFLNYSQLVVGVNANIFIRIPPGALPIGIP